jgi:FMN phosphatase YigB (HAD superfamily)
MNSIKFTPKIFQLEINKDRAEFQSSIMICDNFDTDIYSSLNTRMEAILFNLKTAYLILQIILLIHSQLELNRKNSDA